MLIPPRWQSPCMTHIPQRSTHVTHPLRCTHVVSYLNSNMHAGSAHRAYGFPSSPNLLLYTILVFLVSGTLSWGAGQFPGTGKSPQLCSRDLSAPQGWILTTGSFKLFWAHQVCKRADQGDLECHMNKTNTHNSIIPVLRNKFSAKTSHLSDPFPDPFPFHIPGVFRQLMPS